MSPATTETDVKDGVLLSLLRAMTGSGSGPDGKPTAKAVGKAHAIAHWLTTAPDGALAEDTPTLTPAEDAPAEDALAKPATPPPEEDPSGGNESVSDTNEDDLIEPTRSPDDAAEDGFVVGDQITLPEDDEDDNDSAQHYAWQNKGEVGQSTTGLPLYKWHDDETGRTRVQHAEPGKGRDVHQQITQERRKTREEQRQQQEEQEKKSPPELAYGKDDAAKVLAEFSPDGWIKPESVPVLVGAPKGSKVECYASKYYGQTKLRITVSHPAIQDCNRTLEVKPDGTLSMHNDLFFLKKKYRGSGLGLDVFSGEVRACLNAGVDEIETCAGRGGVMNGYYTWPRLGYDAPLPYETKSLLRQPGKKLSNILLKAGVPQEEIGERLQALVNSKPATVQDLMSTPDGRAIWKSVGQMMNMKFDLKPGSRSLEVLNDYLKSKGKEEVSVPDNVAHANEVRAAARRKAAVVKSATQPNVVDHYPPGYFEAMRAADSKYWKLADDAGLNRQELSAAASQMVKQGDPNILGADRAQWWPNAYSKALQGMLRNRHNERLNDPELTRRHLEEAEALGHHGPAILHEARRYPMGHADANDAVGQAFRAARSHSEFHVPRVHERHAELPEAVRQRAHEIYHQSLAARNAQPGRFSSMNEPELWEGAYNQAGYEHFQRQQNDEPIYMERDRPSLHYEAHHAPAGGIDIAGRHFDGGEFIPSDVAAQATAEEKNRLLKASTGDKQEQQAGSAGSQVHQSRVASMLAAAEDIPVTDKRTGEPVSRRDYDEIENRMDSEQRKEMERVLARAKRTSINDAISDFSPDIDEWDLASGLNLDANSIESKADDLFAEYDMTAPSLRGSQHGLDGIDALIDSLDEDAPDELKERLQSWRDEAETELNDRRKEWEIEQEEEAKSEAEDNYDDSESRGEYLRDFYDENPDMFSSQPMDEDTWYTDDDDDGILRFSTTSGQKYNVGAVYRDGMPFPDMQFSDEKNSFAVTGGGQAMQVFSKVVPAILAYFKKKDLPGGTFSAAEPSRQRLYDRLTRTVASAMPEYSAFTVDNNGTRYYMVVKKEHQQEMFDHIKSQCAGLEPAALYAKDDDDFEPIPVPPETDPTWWKPEGWPVLPAEKKPNGGKPKGKPEEYTSARSPVGGITIGGKTYKGGAFIPGKALAKATPAEKQQLKAKQADSVTSDGPASLQGEALAKWYANLFNVLHKSEGGPSDALVGVAQAELDDSGYSVSDDSGTWQVVAEKQLHKFASTQFDLPKMLADAIREFGERIPNKELAADGREDHIHITCKYGLHSDSPDEVRNLVQGFGSVPMKFGKVSIFPAKEGDDQRGGDSFDVVKIEVISPELRKLNKLISDNIECTDTHPKYNPHITIAYLKPGNGKKYVGDRTFEGVGFIGSELLFSGKDRQLTPISLIEDNKPNDTAAELADWYANLFNDLVASGSEPDQDTIAAADAELAGTGCGVDVDEDTGRWEKREESDVTAYLDDDEAETYAAGDPWVAYTGKRGARKGQQGWRKGGRVVWGEKPPSSRPRLGPGELKRSKAGKVSPVEGRDATALRERLAKHAADLTPGQQGNARRSLASLKRYHGEGAAARAHDIADQVEAALESLESSDKPAERKEYLAGRLRARLAQLHAVAVEGMQKPVIHLDAQGEEPGIDTSELVAKPKAAPIAPAAPVDPRLTMRKHRLQTLIARDAATARGTAVPKTRAKYEAKVAAQQAELAEVEAKLKEHWDKIEAGSGTEAVPDAMPTPEPTVVAEPTPEAVVEPTPEPVSPTPEATPAAAEVPALTRTPAEHIAAGGTGADHFEQVKAAILAGEQVPEASLATYPVLQSLAQKKQEQSNAEIAAIAATAGPGPVSEPDRGGDHSGNAGGPDGAARDRPFQPRIVTARSEHTRTGNPSLVPEAIRHHLNETQQQGVSLAIAAMEEHGGFLLADGTGVGKTRQQLAVAQHFAGKGKKVVIVSPAEVIKPNWAKSSMSGSFANDSAAMGVNSKLAKGDTPLTSGSIHVTTYNELGKLKDHIDKDTVVIFDESHSMKNRDSARYKHGKDIMDKAGAVMYATATPGDKPLHIAHLARAGVFGNAGTTKTYEKLGMKLVDQHIGGGQTVKCWQVDPKVGYTEMARRMSGLFDQMTKDGLMVKRELSMDGVDVGMSRVALSQEEHEAVQKAYNRQFKETNGNKAVALMAARLHQEPFKIPHTVQMVKDELAEGRSPVIFLGRVNATGGTEGSEDDKEEDGFSEGTAKSLKAALIAAGIPESEIGELHGGATKTAEQKKKAMDRFQSNTSKVMIATIQSGGTGINLDDTSGTRPRTMIMMTPPFTANDMAQAAGRVHRLNTRSSARVRGVLSDTAIDDWNAGVLEKKFKTLGAIVGGEATRSEGAIRPTNAPDIDEDGQSFDWGESLHKRAAAPRIKITGNTFAHREALKAAGGRWDAAEQAWTMPGDAAEKVRHLKGLEFSDRKPTTAATASTPAPQPGPVGPPPAPAPVAPVSPERKQAIHQALRQLHAVNGDRASERNDVGFNQADSLTGGRLAEQGELSDADADRAIKFLGKYKRQLGEDLHRVITTEDKPAKKDTPSAGPDIRTVQTRNGERRVHAFTPSASFWDARKKGKVPSSVSVRKNDRTGDWEASVWGANDQEVIDALEKMRAAGVRLNYQAGDEWSEPDDVIAEETGVVPYALDNRLVHVAPDVGSGPIVLRSPRDEDGRVQNIHVHITMPTQPAPVVNVAAPIVNMAPITVNTPERVKMDVVSMPTATETTKITRDRYGNMEEASKRTKYETVE